MLFIPVVGIVGVISKIPESWKEVFFKVPTFVTSTACSFVLKMFVHGVMGPYAVILGDLILYPIFTLWKKARVAKKERAVKKIGTSSISYNKSIQSKPKNLVLKPA
jgi:hypothetical protein